MKRGFCWPVLVALLLLSGTAVAQPPAAEGDAQAMAARPLMVGDLPVGTVTVRVGRGSLSNAAVGIDVVASVTAPGGKATMRTEKTKSDGRATFADLPVGAQFQAQAVVDGQRLQTASFAIPAEGGARLMLLSQQDQEEGEGKAAPTPAEPHAGAHGHGGTPTETANDTGEGTSDPSVVRVSSSSKLLIDLREDALAVMENLVLENTSDRIFRADHGGIAIPLPSGANDVEAIEGSARLELEQGSTLFLREAIPPASSHTPPVQARFGYFVPAAGENAITLRQPMPLGIEEPVVMVPETVHLTLAAPGLHAMAPQTDDRGARILIFQLASVPRNGVLSITVSGLPTRGGLGKTIAAVLVAALVFAVVLGWRRPRVEKRPEKRRSRRDELFAELVEVERARRAAGAGDAPLAQRRAELVAAVEAADNASSADKPA
jgi:hypothetical protein